MPQWSPGKVSRWSVLFWQILKICFKIYSRILLIFLKYSYFSDESSDTLLGIFQDNALIFFQIYVLLVLHIERLLEVELHPMTFVPLWIIESRQFYQGFNYKLFLLMLVLPNAIVDDSLKNKNKIIVMFNNSRKTVFFLFTSEPLWILINDFK